MRLQDEVIVIETVKVEEWSGWWDVWMLVWAGAQWAATVYNHA